MLQSEHDNRNFILAFRDIIKKHAEIQIYEDFDEDADDLGLTEQQFMDYRSKYLDIYDSVMQQQKVQDDNDSDFGNMVNDDLVTDEGGLEDIDFCLELLHSDIINVAYILALIADLDPYSKNYLDKRKELIETMIKDSELRAKVKLIDGFIQENVDNDKENFMQRKQSADGTTDLEERLSNYITKKRNKAIQVVADEEGLNIEILNHYLSEYLFLHKEQTEIIQDALREKHFGLSKRRRVLNSILDKLRLIIKTYTWD